MMDDHVVIENLDCHAHAYDGEDGYPTLVEIAERYGVLISEADGLPGWEGWADWYRVEGPRAHVVRFLTEEYCGDEAQAEEIIEGTSGPTPGTIIG